MKDDKNKNQFNKRRKDIKTLRKNEKGEKEKKTLTENNKKEGTEDQGSGTWIGSFHSLLSNANSLVIHQSFNVKFDRPLPLFSLSVE
jgi:hypothetical protein